MNLDMTFCAAKSQWDCPVALQCQRASAIPPTFESYRTISVGTFQPEKGKDCEGYLPKDVKTTPSKM